MKIDKHITKLICELENKIGNQTYNPNSYNGWTGEGGCSFKYPVNYCITRRDLEEEKLTKTKYLIESMEPECIGTMKYAFGSNHLYIGDGIVKALEYIEAIYDIDFNELEERRFQKKLENMDKIRTLLDDGDTIEVKSGRYIVGEDFSEGEYVVINDSGYIYMDIYYKNGNVKKQIFTTEKEKKVKLKSGQSINARISYKLKKISSAD